MRVPLLGLVLAVLALVTAAHSPDQVVACLALATLLVVVGRLPVAATTSSAATSLEHRSQVWRGVGIRLHDPSRPGRVHPRAPGRR